MHPLPLGLGGWNEEFICKPICNIISISRPPNRFATIDNNGLVRFRPSLLKYSFGTRLWICKIQALHFTRCWSWACGEAKLGERGEGVEWWLLCNYDELWKIEADFLENSAGNWKTIWIIKIVVIPAIKIVPGRVEWTETLKEMQSFYETAASSPCACPPCPVALFWLNWFPQLLSQVASKQSWFCFYYFSARYDACHQYWRDGGMEGWRGGEPSKSFAGSV